jgi:hypothetical protein
VTIVPSDGEVWRPIPQYRVPQDARPARNTDNTPTDLRFLPCIGDIGEYRFRTGKTGLDVIQRQRKVSGRDARP